MKKEQFLSQLEQYEGEECITIITNQDEHTIEDGECFIGGRENTYMSQLLGNVAYDSLRHIGSEIYNYITNELHETIEEVEPY